MACTTVPNFRAIALKMPSLEGVKYFNKTGNRKISAGMICPKICGNSQGVSADVLAKFKKNVVWKKFSKVSDRISEIIILCFKCPVGIVVSYTRFKFGSNRPRNAAAMRPRKKHKTGSGAKSSGAISLKKPQTVL